MHADNSVSFLKIMLVDLFRYWYGLYPFGEEFNAVIPFYDILLKKQIFAVNIIHLECYLWQTPLVGQPLKENFRHYHKILHKINKLFKYL